MNVYWLQEKLLHTMVATEDIEEVEILKARFDTFDQEVKANADKVEVVNQLSRQLLNNQHPNSDDVVRREKQLNQKYCCSFIVSWLLVGIGV